MRVDIQGEPFGVPMTTPFADDHDHASYDTDAVARFLRILQWSADVLEEFAGWYCGKTSPVHLFWHGFDLATSRFSGSGPTAQPGVDAVTAEAYSHEVISFGFWAGDENSPSPPTTPTPHPSPRPHTAAACGPRARRWAPAGNGSLAILAVRRRPTRSDPKALLARVPPERLRSRRVPRRLGPRRHRDAMVPVPTRSLGESGATRFRVAYKQEAGVRDRQRPLGRCGRPRSWSSYL